MIETLKKTPVMCIQDDYEAHSSHDWESSWGKLHLVDQADYNTQHIFFDDCAEPGNKNIIDCRDLVTGKPIENSENLYYVRVNP